MSTILEKQGSSDEDSESSEDLSDISPTKTSTTKQVEKFYDSSAKKLDSRSTTHNNVPKVGQRFDSSIIYPIKDQAESTTASDIKSVVAPKTSVGQNMKEKKNRWIKIRETNKKSSNAVRRTLNQSKVLRMPKFALSSHTALKVRTPSPACYRTRVRDSSWTGDIKDPVLEKLLDAINSENEEALQRHINEHGRELERIRSADVQGATLLHFASSRCNAAIVSLLLECGFDVNKKTAKRLELYLESYDYVSKFRPGSTALYIATVAGNASIVSLLAKHGANANISDCEGFTPLHNAAWHNKIELIRFLLSYGAKINAQDGTGSTPLRKAAYRGHTDAVNLLLNHGADPNLRTKRGRAPIHCAALYGHTEVLVALVNSGAKVDIEDNDDVTPLHAAVYNGKRLAVRALIKAKATINKQTKFGNTPLHLACMERWFVITSLLMQSGADETITNRFTETAASIIGDSSKRISVLNKKKAPTLAELEKMEAEGRNSVEYPSLANMTAFNHAEIHDTQNNVVNNNTNDKQKKDGKDKKKKHVKIDS